MDKEELPTGKPSINKHHHNHNSSKVVVSPNRAETVACERFMWVTKSQLEPFCTDGLSKQMSALMFPTLTGRCRSGALTRR